MELMTQLESMDAMALLTWIASVRATRGSTVTGGAEQTESERFSPSMQRE